MDELYRLEIDIRPMVRFYGCDGSTTELERLTRGIWWRMA